MIDGRPGFQRCGSSSASFRNGGKQREVSGDGHSAKVMLDDPLPHQWVYLHSAFQKWAQQHEGTCERSQKGLAPLCTLGICGNLKENGLAKHS